MNPATKVASSNLYVEISLYNNVGSVWKFSFLKKDIIVKSPKLKAKEKEKTNNIFFLIKGKIILKKFISVIKKDFFKSS